MKQITKKIGVLVLFALLLSIAVPNMEAKAETTYKGKTIASDVTATYTDSDLKKVDFSEVRGNYKFVYTVKMYNFLTGNEPSYIECELSSVKIYKKQNSSWVKTSKSDVVDMLEIPSYISVPNITFVQSYYDDGRTKTLKSHKIKLIASVNTNDDSDISNDASFFANSFDCTVNTFIIPFDNPAFDLAEAWFNNFGGHIGTIVIAGTDYNDTTNYQSNLFNYIDYYAIEKTLVDNLYENVEDGYMTLEDCQSYFKENNLLDYYNNVFVTKKDPKRADFSSALQGTYKEYESPVNIELAETPTTSTDNTSASGYGTFSNLNSTKKEYLSVLTDGSYCLYAKNNKDNIIRYELSILENGKISINEIRVFQNTDDYLEEKEFKTTEIPTTLGDIVIPSTITLAGKSYNVVKTSGINEVLGYYFDSLTIPNTIEEVIALQGYDENYFTQTPVKTLNISKSLKTVCPYLLKNVTTVKLSTDNPYLSYASGFLYSKDYKILYSTIAKKVRNVSIKSTVQTIEKNALSNLWIYQGGTITLPSSLKMIKSQENWRNENGAIIVSKRDYTIQFKGATPPKIESFPMLLNYYVVTPNTSNAINSYKALKDTNGNKVFTSDYIVTKHYYKNLSVLTKLQKDLKKLTTKPSEISSSDWKYIVSKAKSITKGCKTDTEKVKAIDSYIRSLTLNESATKNYEAKTKYGSYDYVALIKKGQYTKDSDHGLFGLLTKAIGVESVQTCTLNADLFSTYSYDTAVLLDNKTWVFFSFDGSKQDSNSNYMVSALNFFTQDCGYGEKIGTLITIYDEFK